MKVVYILDIFTRLTYGDNHKVSFEYPEHPTDDQISSLLKQAKNSPLVRHVYATVEKRYYSA